jgi:L-asparagine transporter-like permease
MIFVTHLFFRRRWEALGWPRLPVCMIGYTTILGAAFLLAILLITWWVQGMRLCLITRLPWLAFIPTVYWLFLVKRARSVEEEHIARQVAKHAKIQKGLSFAPWREILVRT